MTVLQSSVDWVLNQAHLRLGDPYVYGGVYSPTDVSQGADCSGVVGWVLEALVNTPANMSWAHNVSTESWYFDYGNNTPSAPGTVGPYGTVAVASLGDIPADAALTIDIMHGGGGEDSHTNCSLNGTLIESNGDYGSCTNGTGAYATNADLWTDHWYLPGPIVADAPPPPPANTLFYPDTSNNQWSSVDQLTNFLSQLHAEGFAGICHKVSQGATFQDIYWKPCRAWCEANDLSWLGFHYCTTDDPASQANNFVANYGGGNVMLDFEQDSGDINNFWAIVQAFNNANVNVSLAYLPRWYWQQIGSPDLSPLPANGIRLISSDYESNPTGTAQEIYNQQGGDNGPGWASYGGCTPAAWQFTDHASIAGITVDCNVHHTPETDLDGFFTGAGI
jgi:hypothetical protein